MNSMMNEKDEDEPPERSVCSLKDRLSDSTLEISIDIDTGDEIVEKLKDFEQGIDLARPAHLAKMFFSLLGPSLYLGLSNYGYDLLNLLGFYIANTSQSMELESSFGLTIFFNSVLIFGFFYSIDEKVGLASAVNFGAKRYADVKGSLWKGFLTVAAMTVLYFGPVVWYSEGLLISIGLAPSNAALCSSLLKRLFPLDLFRMFNEMIMTYVLAQGVDTNFGTISAINIVVSLFAGAVAHWAGLGIDAWLVCRAVHEAIMLGMVLHPFLYKIEEQTRGISSFKEIITGYQSFLKDTFKYVVSLYSEWIGAEIAIYFTGLTQDQRQIAAHTALANFACFVMNTGLGFSTVGRTRVNLLLGKGLKTAARNFFVVFLAGLVGVGFTMSALVLLLRPALVWVYAGAVPEVAHLFSNLLLLYALFLPLDLIYPFLFTVCRSAGQVTLSILLNLVLLIGYCTIMDYHLIINKGMTCKELVINMYLTLLLIFSLLITRLTKKNWASHSSIREPKSNPLEIELKALS